MSSPVAPPPPPLLPPPPGPHRWPRPRWSREEAIRRGWGAYFAIWALALLALLVVGSVLLGPELSAWPGRAIATWLAWLAITVAAGLGTLSHFRGVWQATHFPLWKVGRGFLASFALLLAGLTFAAWAPEPFALAGLGLTLLPVALILWYQLRSSFEHVPGEAWAATGALAASAVLSATAMLLTGEILLYGACWLLTIVVWSTSAGYAFLQAPRRFSPGRAMGGA